MRFSKGNSMKDNNQLLAEKIYKIENAPWKQVKEWRQNGITKWQITDKICLEVSDDCMCWYLWKHDGFFKVVPKVHCDTKTIENILKAQSWAWI